MNSPLDHQFQAALAGFWIHRQESTEGNFHLHHGWRHLGIRVWDGLRIATPFCERVGRILFLGEALCDMVQKEQLCRGPGKPMFIEETCLELHRVIVRCFEYWTYLGSNTTEPGSNQQVFGDLRWISAKCHVVPHAKNRANSCPKNAGMF